MFHNFIFMPSSDKFLSNQIAEKKLKKIILKYSVKQFINELRQISNN